MEMSWTEIWLVVILVSNLAISMRKVVEFVGKHLRVRCQKCCNSTDLLEEEEY